MTVEKNEQNDKAIHMFIENIGKLYDGWVLLCFMPPQQFKVINKNINEDWSSLFPEINTEISQSNMYNDEGVFNRYWKKLRNCIFSFKPCNYRESFATEEQTFVEMNLIPFQLDNNQIYILTLMKNITPQILQENYSNEGLKKMQLQRSLLLEYEMKTAINNIEFEVYYQPKLHVKKKKINMEALIRWFNPRLGVIEPTEFIPLAEKVCLIRPITNIVINKLFEDFTDIGKVYTGAVLSVNISSALLKDLDWITNDLKEMIKQHNVDPSNFEFELTEHYLVDFDTINAGITELSALGFEITLNDFGLKYSSLQYLREIKCNKVKINRSFTKNINTVMEERRIVLKIMDVAHSLNMEVAAVGIEDQRLCETLVTYGCDELQGYYIGKPVGKKLLLENINNYLTTLQKFNN